MLIQLQATVWLQAVSLVVLAVHVLAVTPGQSLPTIREEHTLPDLRYVPFNPRIETVHPLEFDLGDSDDETPSTPDSRASSAPSSPGSSPVGSPPSSTVRGGGIGAGVGSDGFKSPRWKVPGLKLPKWQAPAWMKGLSRPKLTADRVVAQAVGSVVGTGRNPPAIASSGTPAITEPNQVASSAAEPVQVALPLNDATRTAPAVAPKTVPILRIGSRWDGIRLTGNRLEDAQILTAMRLRAKPFYLSHPTGQMTFIKSDGSTRPLNGYERDLITDEFAKAQNRQLETITLPTTVRQGVAAEAAHAPAAWWTRLVKGGKGWWIKTMGGVKEGLGRLKPM